MDAVQQAKVLLERVQDALSSMKRFDDFPDATSEGEVVFRYEAIVGILIIARNELRDMVTEWEKKE